MLKLYDCKVARRGKAAKGTVNVKMFGEPILDTDGVAKDFKTAEAVLNKPIEMVIAEVRAAMTVNDAMLGIAILNGLNDMNRSETAKDQNEIGLLANRIFANGLSTDKDEAFRLANAAIPRIRYAVEQEYISDMEVGIIDWLKKRSAFVDELKTAGQWAKVTDKLPRLVKTPEVKQ